MAYAPAVRLRRPRDEAGKRDVDDRMLNRDAAIANRGIHFSPLRFSHLDPRVIRAKDVPNGGPLMNDNIDVNDKLLLTNCLEQ